MKGDESGGYRATYCQSMIAHFLAQNQNSSFYFYLKKTNGDKRVAGKHVDAIMYLLKRHAALQTTYHIADDTVYCRPSLAIRRKNICEEIDAPNWQDVQISEYLQMFFQQTALDIEKGPITRIFIFYTSPQEFVLAVVSQHIAFDAYSLILLNNELINLLAVDAEDYSSAVAPIKYDFSVYAKWEHELCHSAEGTKRANYWRELLADYQPINLPVDYRSKDEEAPGLRQLYVLNEPQTSQLKLIAKQNQCSINLLMFCVYIITLSLFSKQKKFTIVTPFSNRHVKTRFIRVVGNFLDYLPIFAHIDSKHSIEQSIGITLDAIAQAKKNYLPLGRIMGLLQKKDDIDHLTTLLQCYVNCIPRRGKIPPPLLSLPEESEMLVGAGNSAERQELALFFSEYNGSLRWRFSDRPDLFSSGSMQSIEALLRKVLAALLDNIGSSKEIGDIERTYSADLVHVTIRNDC